MKKIFLDSDVILNLLLNREPYHEDIAELIEFTIQDGVELFVSSVTIINLNYIICRIENKKSAASKTDKILQLVKVENVGESTVIKSL